MNARSTLRSMLRPFYTDRPRVKRILRDTDVAVDLARHAAAQVYPQLIRPDPRRLFISVTANCNSRCKGCLYGREFMHGHQLPLPMVKDLLDDAKELGFERVRLYGGEPLVHKDLPQIVEHLARLDLKMWVTTNGILLKNKIDDLVDAGLRQLSVGMYGIGEAYNTYVQRPGTFDRVEEGIAYTRERYGMDLFMHLDWLLMRPTCNLDTLSKTWELAQRYRMPIYVNLVHYSLPYFTEGEERELQFTPEDRPAIEAVVAQLLRYKEQQPDLLLNTKPGLRSIPDWLLRGPAMRVPCTEYRLIWVGPDGSVQMCYVTFKLGNLHEKRLKELLFTPEHDAAARGAFQLNCPNCHCSYDARVLRHGPTLIQYSG